MNAYLRVLILLTIAKTNICQLVGSDAEVESVFDEELYQKILDPVKCEEQLNFLSNNTSVALLFLDASGKIPSGIKSGNLADLGSYDQCLDILHIEEDMEIEGKYCMMQIPLEPLTKLNILDASDLELLIDNSTLDNIKKVEIASNQTSMIIEGRESMFRQEKIMPSGLAAALIISWAACVPKVCNSRDAIDFLLQEKFPNFNKNLTYTEQFCRVPNDKKYSIADYLALVIFSLLLLLTLISTSYDLYHEFVLHTEDSQRQTLYCCFSVYTNTRRFLTFNTVPGALECVDGVRAISMLWVIVCHVYTFNMLSFISNYKEVSIWLTSFKSIWINSAPVTVDTFFTLSGILCVYTIVGKISRKRFIFSLHYFYLHRLLRIFPLLAAVVLLQASLFYRVSDGPMWSNMGHMTAVCRERWWATLLHVQNYVKPINVCLAQTWYLSVDVQLYIFSPVVLICLFGSRSIAWFSLALAVLVSLSLSTTYSFMNNYSAAIANPHRSSEISAYFKDYYINTLTRASPFMIGMAYGYILHVYRGKKIQMNKNVVYLGWILAFTLMAFCIFSIYPVMQVDHDKQMFDNFLNAYMRGIWAVAIGWLIFASVHGYGGPINWFLCLRIWKLPARLSYAMYLTHVSIIMTANASMRTTYYFTDGETMYRAMAAFVYTGLASFLLSILIDAPCSTLQKRLLGGGMRKVKNHKAESTTEIVEDKKDVATVK